jgi:hypothetical protein
VGEACIHRWGEGVTGCRIFGEVLSSAYARYIRSLELDTITRRAPIFSEAIFELGNDMMMTGRLFAPFTRHGSDGASVVFGLQLFNGPPVPLAEISRAGFTSEIQRQIIVAAPGLLAQMEKARHYYQLSRHAHQNELTEMLARISRETIGASLRPLPTFERESVAPE